MDKRQLARKKEHHTRPPRLKPKAHSAEMHPEKKRKGSVPGRLPTPRFCIEDSSPRRPTVPKANPGVAPGRTNLPDGL